MRTLGLGRLIVRFKFIVGDSRSGFRKVEPKLSLILYLPLDNRNLGSMCEIKSDKSIF